MDIERLGPYQIVGKLGRGGMGTVYEGVHRETGEPAAVKLLAAGLAEEEDFRVRFQAEIEALRKLNHPNIVRLFGFGEQEGHLFYAMELVDGNSLEEELRRGRRFDCREVTQIGIDTCHALRHAHDRGIIHRDLKPANLLLSSDGHVKLSDFGIARLFGYSRLTSAGNVLGTVEYMAPEQAEAKPVDARADLYSLGAVMYALLAGRPAFRGKSLPEVLHKQRFELPEPLRKHAPDVPVELERILHQLLEKDPDRRIPNANVLGRLLEATLHWLNIGPETVEAGSAWFQPGQSLLLPETGKAAISPDDLPATRVLDESEKRDLSEKRSQAASSPAPPGAKEKPAQTAPGAFSETVPDASYRTGRFVPVGAHELDRAAEEEPRPVFSWQTGVLVAALLLIGAGVWWSLQPPTADALYDRIEAKAAAESIDSLRDAKNDIREFLSHFSGDPRAARLRRYEQEIELNELEREFNLRIRGHVGTEGLRPIQRDYLEAINYDPLEPERGIVKLQALIDLYEQPSCDAEPAAWQCLKLARRRLAQLQAEVEERAKSRLASLQERLQTADDLQQSDPQGARAMYRAVVELYGNKPWAAHAVSHAREALKQIDR